MKRQHYLLKKREVIFWKAIHTISYKKRAITEKKSVLCHCIPGLAKAWGLRGLDPDVLNLDEVQNLIKNDDIIYGRRLDYLTCS